MNLLKCQKNKTQKKTYKLKSNIKIVNNANILEENEIINIEDINNIDTLNKAINNIKQQGETSLLCNFFNFLIIYYLNILASKNILVDIMKQTNLLFFLKR